MTFVGISEHFCLGVSDEVGVDWGFNEELYHRPKDMGSEVQEREQNP